MRLAPGKTSRVLWNVERNECENLCGHTFFVEYTGVPLFSPNINSTLSSFTVLFLHVLILSSCYATEEILTKRRTSFIIIKVKVSFVDIIIYTVELANR